MGFQAAAKWDAWSQLAGCPPDLARASYVGNSDDGQRARGQSFQKPVMRCKSWRLMCPTGSSEVGKCGDGIV